MRGFPGSRRARVLLFGLASVALLPAQTDRVAALGEVLFATQALSPGRMTSCTTCHDPKKSFADGQAEAKGALQIEIGRNSPTLFAMSSIPKFRDPRQAQDAKPGKSPRVL